MARPHYNIQAGTRIHPRQGAPDGAGAAGGCPACKEKSAEVERLRRELAAAQSGSARGLGKPGATIMWAALAICAACIVFALAAFVRHG